jgi:hypothetical protein
MKRDWLDRCSMNGLVLSLQPKDGDEPRAPTHVHGEKVILKSLRVAFIDAGSVGQDLISLCPGRECSDQERPSPSLAVKCWWLSEYVLSDIRPFP